jgi:hypothetical protein
MGSRSCEHSILTAVMKRTREMGSAMGGHVSIQFLQPQQ